MWWRCKCSTEEVVTRGVRLACLRSLINPQARWAMAAGWGTNHHRATPCGRKRCEVEAQNQEFRRLLGFAETGKL